MTKAKTVRRCKGVTAKGDRCAHTHDLSEDDFCLWHDPGRTEERRALQSRGGRKRSTDLALTEEAPPPPQTLDDCVTWSSWIAHAVATGQISYSAGRIAVQAIAELRRSLEKRDLEREAADLRRQVKKLKQQLGK